MYKSLLSILTIPAFIVAFVLPAFAQQANTPSLTSANYEHAEKFLVYNTSQLVDRGNIKPKWLADDRFWYRVLTAQGSEFILADPARGTRVAAFDQQKLAAALGSATGNKYEAFRLPFLTFHFSPDGKSILFSAAQKNWKCDLNTYNCTVDNTSVTADATAQMQPAMSISPDGKRAVFIRDFNLWVRSLATNKEAQLTTDGVKDFGYATDNAGWKHSDNPIVTWSPDSKKIATFQQDQRKVSDMYLVTTNVGKPKLEVWKYPLPGDKDIVKIQRVIIEVDNPKVVRLKIAPDAHRGTLCDDISCSGSEFGDVDWSKDGSHLAFVSTSRDHKQETLWMAEATTGSIRQVLEENVATQFESGQGSVNWRYLQTSNEIIWYSERDNWGHLYLYNAATGKLKNQVTKGDWTISELLKVDEKNRTLYFLAGGREPGRNPYFSHLYKVGFNGTNLTLLTPEDGNHKIEISPSGRYFIDSYSKQDVPPVMVLRNWNGKLVTNLEKTDISRLTATGWKPPTPIIVKARDGHADLYGLMYTPTNLDPQKKYPVVNYIYPGRRVEAFAVGLLKRPPSTTRHWQN
ncbi:MAG TPA: DPP IV N-terminal domain-containing protein [Segetibacter sp.]